MFEIGWERACSRIGHVYLDKTVVADITCFMGEENYFLPGDERKDSPKLRYKIMCVRFLDTEEIIHFHNQKELEKYLAWRYDNVDR